MCSSRAAPAEFGGSGLDIQTAMVRQALAHANPATRPRHILWNGLEIWTSFDLAVPRSGRFQLEFLSPPRVPPQGVDVKVEAGRVVLDGADPVQTLRTWHEWKYDPVVQYRFESKVGLVKVWNVYRREWPNGRTTDEKWTGNAGFAVESEASCQWLFRCSHGGAPAPDFDQLVFRMSVFGDE